MALSRRNRLLMGLTLFSMFFGAGNLIFPPFLAYQAGGATWPAMAGFCLTAIGFPILGVVAVAKSGGLDTLARRVNPLFAQVFVLLTYLSIGPGLAIPRNSVTSFEMAILPFLGEGAPVGTLQFIYSVVFFAVAVLVALRPEKLSDRLGKILTPILLVLIAAVFFGCIFTPNQGYGATSGIYGVHPFSQGFLDGYQTMDAIAALNFGFIIALNIRAKGVEEEKSVVGETVRAGWVAGALLLVVYCALAHIGGVAGGTFEGATNGARTLTGMVARLFGPVGNLLLAVIFVIACLNTCIGLLTCCSDYFHKLVPKVSYRAWVLFFAITSTLVANAGLNAILSVSVPILGAIYPVALVLITLGLFHRWVGRRQMIYPVAILLTGIVSVLSALDGIGLCPGFLTAGLNALPLAGQGLPWLVPALLGILVGALLPGRKGTAAS